MSLKATILFLLSCFFLSPAIIAQPEHIRVSEVFVSGSGNGWIELYNGGNQSIDANLFRLEFGDVNVPISNERLNPSTYIIIPVSDLPVEFTPEKQLIRIPAITLYSLNDERIHGFPGLEKPSGSSVGLTGVQNQVLGLFSSPTPAETNSSDFKSVQLSAPTFSAPPGFYSQNINLSIETIHTGVEIRYTTDGSEPDENSPIYTNNLTLTNLVGASNVFSMIPTNQFGPGHPYNEEWQPPLGEVKKLNIIRAKVFFEGAESSEVSTASYLIDSQAANRYSMPVISISSDGDNFFDPDMGIYVWGNNGNYNQRGSEWERPIFMEFFKDDGSPAFAQNLGIRIHGGTSRSRPRKSLRLYARSDYGASWVNYPLFTDKPIGEFKRFLLRNSGNDWDRAIFRDAFMQHLVKGIGLDLQYSRPSIVFLNGEYWGIHNIRDRLDERYIETHYGLEEDEFTMLENNSVFDNGNEAGVDHYNQMRTFVSNQNMAIQSNYEYVKTQMDVDNFIDYQATQIYLRNTDWPGNNLQYWRSFNDYNPNAPHGLDGRWRWMLFDTDFGFNLDFDYVQGHPEGPAHNTLAFAMQAGGTNWPNPDWSTLLLRRLATNTDFRNQFINRFADLLNTNFREDVVAASLDSLEALYLPEMQEHIDRWRRPVTMDSWQETLNSMREFGELRPQYMRQFIQSQFGLSDIFELTLNVSDQDMGNVQINRTRIESGTPGVGNQAYPWSGTYFKNIPIEITAIPKSGYQFVQWQGASSSTEATIVHTFTGNASLTAIFESAEEEPGDIEPWILADAPYVFTEWSSSAPAGTYPPSMVFYQTNQLDPRLNDELTDPWILPYNLTNRSRINGLGADGFSFINTGNAQENGGGFLGTAVLALSSAGLDDIEVTWRGGTILTNSRVYNIRLQYRVGANTDFEDVLFPNGEPVEYEWSDTNGHSEMIGPVQLPTSVHDREYVELRWKYYYTGTRLDENSGQRSQLRISDILVSSGSSGTAQGLAFEQLFPTAQTNKPAPPIRVQALNEDGLPDLTFNEEITIQISDGTGNLTGTLTVTAEGGEAVFDDVSFSASGLYTLKAVSETIQNATSEPIRVVKLSEVLMPQFMQGNQPDNNDRVPFAFRVKLEGLKENAVYRYYNRVIDDNDPWNQDGAGNAIFVDVDGGNFLRTTQSPRFRGTDFGTRHFDFLTTADGTFEGWFVTEPSGNNRFSPENLLRMRVLLNDGDGGEEFHHFIDTFFDVRVIRFGTVPGQATGFVGSSSAIARNFIAMYEDENGEGRPISVSFVEDAGFSVDDRYADFYLNVVNGEAGFWGAILPNDLPNGIRRIEERSLIDGYLSSFAISTDGMWENGVSTINPNGGLDNPIIIQLGNEVPIESPNDVPSEFTLLQNYPNPFNPSTQISYGIPESTHVRLEVYSINGQLVTVLQNGVQSAGYHTVTFDSRSANMASGVYLYRLEAADFVQVKKMLLVK